ncbi:hypothetical protein RHGRI_006647 [Rhododendron griersonianum]|uniref:J domain-containing protein n=1 Tax=Rhododendron griersonianum TaxID=479676 RepID=A0AAV6KTY8_9ERIC|nr:hypothetical protein RHGRI_006647 [Rhododendron griersonianum]
MDPYKAALGLDQSASVEEIKRAYRKLALQFHPDKHSHSPNFVRDHATLRFKFVSLAYEGLMDELRRSSSNNNGNNNSRVDYNSSSSNNNNKRGSSRSQSNNNNNNTRSSNNYNKYYYGGRFAGLVILLHIPIGIGTLYLSLGILTLTDLRSLLKIAGGSERVGEASFDDLMDPVELEELIARIEKPPVQSNPLSSSEAAVHI